MSDVENLLQNSLHRTAATQAEAIRQSVEAGLDMHMYSRSADNFIHPLRKLYDEGKISRKRIDDAVLRILTLKFQLGLFENRYIDAAALPSKLRRPEATSAALQAARESVILLTNHNHILPLAPGKYPRILVTGPNADNQMMLGDWAYPQDSAGIVTLLQGIRKEFGNCEVNYIPVGRIKGKSSGTTVNTTDPETQEQHIKEGGEITDFAINQAKTAAYESDLVILAIGGQGPRSDWGLRTYGESADRPSVDFYGKQVELAKAIKETGKPMIVVIFNGKPLNNEWVTAHADAIIDAWEPGMYGGQAVAEVLSGSVNPSGKLPITIPKHAGQIPMFYYQTRSRRYTGYSIGGTPSDNYPAFCFGHGLSYTSFSCKDTAPTDTILTWEKPFQVEVDVTNTGERDGAQTVMLFVRDDVSSVVTAEKRLAAFKKVYLHAGETQRITLEVPFNAFKLWNRDMDFVAEPGTFTLYVGEKADHTYFKRSITLKEK